ncbi:hypothetical protein GCM10023189_39950 [Nibrella saemangeumensis]|uniref:Outer membrane protein beta-barrel domain-containing protein n=1 Tax=Nibrella saemangeumensis TaxID=1084526 RepID=A0ABP8NAU2_9BACT
MKSLRKVVWASAGLWLLVFGSTKAQTADSDEDNYTSVTTYGVTTNTNSGILGGFAFRQAKLLPGTMFGKKQFRYISVEVVNVKHPKEIQQQTSISGSRYIYGKQNFLFVVRPQYGRELTLFRRNADEGVAINAILAAGPSLGIIKPYYVQVSYGNQTRNIPYRPALANSPTENIIGSGGFFQGFGKSELTVGVNVKAAVSFELSAFRNNTTGIEIGVLAEAFPKQIVIIPNTTNRNFFTSGYATLFFGTKK